MFVRELDTLGIAYHSPALNPFADKLRCALWHRVWVGLGVVKTLKPQGSEGTVPPVCGPWACITNVVHPIGTGMPCISLTQSKALG